MDELNLEKIIELDKKGYSLKEIALECNTYYQRIQEFLKKNNYQRSADFHRTYKINDDYFENIDNEMKAYLLGFFAADGGILNDNRLTVCLAETDKQIVELFSKELGIDKLEEISNCQNGAIFRQRQFKIRFKSYKMLKDLEVFGIKYKKSLNEMSFIGKIPKELEHHFVRGYFDGDGHISDVCSKRKTSCYMCGITNSTRNILEEFSTILNVLGIKNRIIVSKNKTEYYTIYLPSTRHACKFGEYIYKDATVFLQRKRDKFDKANTVLTYLNNNGK